MNRKGFIKRITALGAGFFALPLAAKPNDEQYKHTSDNGDDGFYCLFTSDMGGMYAKISMNESEDRDFLHTSIIEEEVCKSTLGTQSALIYNSSKKYLAHYHYTEMIHIGSGAFYWLATMPKLTNHVHIKNHGFVSQLGQKYLFDGRHWILVGTKETDN